MIGWPPNFNKSFGTSEQQYSYGWLHVTNCLSKRPASMAQCSHKERLHRYHEEVHSSSLPFSICHPAEKAFKLAKLVAQKMAVLLAKYVNLISIALDFVWLLLLDRLNEPCSGFHRCLLVCFVYSTKAQHCTRTENHELTAYFVDADALLYMCHFSYEKCSTKQDERDSVWGQHLL